ncbi:hypothetical protein ACSQ67_006360 [Phaseolus vulgaris]
MQTCHHQSLPTPKAVVGAFASLKLNHPPPFPINSNSMLSFQLAALHFRVQTKPHSTFLSLSLLFYLSRYSSFTLFRPSSIWDLELLEYALIFQIYPKLYADGLSFE